MKGSIVPIEPIKPKPAPGETPPANTGGNPPYIACLWASDSGPPAPVTIGLKAELFPPNQGIKLENPEKGGVPPGPPPIPGKPNPPKPPPPCVPYTALKNGERASLINPLKSSLTISPAIPSLLVTFSNPLSITENVDSITFILASAITSVILR